MPASTVTDGDGGAAPASPPPQAPARDFLGDNDMERIAEGLAVVERQNSAMLQTLRETVSALGHRIRDSRLEAAKLTKLARLRQAEELRCSEELRRAAEARRGEERRGEELRAEAERLRASIRELDRELQAAVAAKAAAAVEGLQKAAPVLLSEGRLEEALADDNDHMWLEQRLDLLDEHLAGGDCESGTAAEVLAMGSAVEPQHRAEEVVTELLDAAVVDAVVFPEILECAVTHPGALACTKTVIRKATVSWCWLGEQSGPPGTTTAAIVSMETTVRCTGDASATALDADDYIALAVQTLANSALELKRNQFKRSTEDDPVVHGKHMAIRELLTSGRVVDCRATESDFGHESYVVQLQEPQTNAGIGAVFKPKIEGDAEGWHRAPMEWVAYELNLLLGMDYIPPVAYRRGGVEVDYKHFEEGAFIYYVPNSKPLRKVAAANWGVPVATMLSDTRILDVLLNNSDRHHGHFLFGEHWSDSRMRPLLIDHAAGFRKEAVVTMEHENAFQTGPVRCVSAKTYLRLRFLDLPTLLAKFKDVLTLEELDLLMQRRDLVLGYLDRLVQERGYHRTVIE
eukprot:SM000159S01795  [mRNA]  locus=s159:323450:327274:- [translate_table: standard]